MARSPRDKAAGKTSAADTTRDRPASAAATAAARKAAEAAEKTRRARLQQATADQRHAQQAATQAESAAEAMGASETGQAGGRVNQGTANTQINDAVVGVDSLALGLSPSQSMALLDATLAQTLGLAMHNAVLRQQADRVVSQALISAACARLIEHASLLSNTPTAEVRS